VASQSLGRQPGTAHLCVYPCTFTLVAGYLGANMLIYADAVSESRFANKFRAILQVASDFSTNGSDNPSMEKRTLFLKDLSTELRAILQNDNLDADVLRVEHGGRQYNYSPVPWIRIYDPQHAPTAQSGFYVVLLFAADGSSVYLSLNQGTSEFRSNAMRAINDDNVLLNRATVARNALSDWVSHVSVLGPDSMDLMGESVPVGEESRRRIRNYELANVYAYKYLISDLPDDSKFKSDLEELLVLLWALESADLATPTEFLKKMSELVPAPIKKIPSTKQGRQLNGNVRKLIELTAEDCAEEHYVALGWSVERVGAQKLGYDLRCTKPDHELHVEVKGTTGKGLEVTLTPNEVRHCRSYPEMAIAVVSRIVIAENETVEDRGELHILEPWELNEARLTPSEYSYRVK
jgi:hypothetical protein